MTRAVRSALAQTVDGIEVIVVVDGPDDATRDALAAIADARVRVVMLPAQGGAPNARNVGVGEARAPWTAFLDDDDEWLPDKLEVQLGLAKAAQVAMPVIASRLINRTPRADSVMPRRLPADGEPISEYLTVRRGLFYGDGFIQTSTIMAPTALLRRVPFTVGLRRQQELDWTLRAVRHDDVELISPPSRWSSGTRTRTGRGSAWRCPGSSSCEWLRDSRDALHPAGVRCLHHERPQLDGGAHPQLHGLPRGAAEARGYGRPGAAGLPDLPADLGIPPQVRRGLRDLVLGRRTPALPAQPT